MTHTHGRYPIRTANTYDLAVFLDKMRKEAMLATLKSTAEDSKWTIDRVRRTKKSAEVKLLTRSERQSRRGDKIARLMEPSSSSSERKMIVAM